MFPSIRSLSSLYKVDRVEFIYRTLIFSSYITDSSIDLESFRVSDSSIGTLHRETNLTAYSSGPVWCFFYFLSWYSHSP